MIGDTDGLGDGESDHSSITVSSKIKSASELQYEISVKTYWAQVMSQNSGLESLYPRIECHFDLMVVNHEVDVLAFEIHY